MSRNNYSLVQRELASARGFEGLDMGTDVWIIARSPLAILGWVFGHSWSVNGHVSYSEPHLMLFPDRTERVRYHPTYRSFPPFGRLKSDNWQIHCAEIAAAFHETPESLIEEITDAIKKRRTLLIDGGGGRLMPSQSKRGGGTHQDYLNWRHDPESGFIQRKDAI